MSLLYRLIALAVTYSLPQGVSGRTQQHEPYLDGAVYDLGPRDKCVVYPAKKCAGIVGNKTRVPQISALLAPVIDHQIQIWESLKMRSPLSVSKECLNFVFTSTCLSYAQPICNDDNTTVTYTQADKKTFERNCKGIAKCFESYFPVNIQYCALLRRLPYKFVGSNVSFSLTKCRTPNVPMCGTNSYGSTMPEWMAIILEKILQASAVWIPALADAGYTKECLSSMIRLTCTYPTCTNDGRLQGYLTRERCESVVKHCLEPIRGSGPLKEGLSSIGQYLICMSLTSGAGY